MKLCCEGVKDENVGWYTLMMATTVKCSCVRLCVDDCPIEAAGHCGVWLTGRRPSRPPNLVTDWHFWTTKVDNGHQPLTKGKSFFLADK